MVALRKLIYLLQNSHYHFGPVVYGFVYELRKDIVTFVLILIVIYVYRFISSRLMGEANIIEEAEGDKTNEAEPIKNLERLLVNLKFEYRPKPLHPVT